MKRLVLAVLAVVCVVAAGAWFLHNENTALKLTAYELRSRSLPEEFEGYRIVQLSDLHGRMFGRDQEDLVAMVRSAHPDIIVITGDLVDSRNYDERPGMTMLRRVRTIAPVFFVTGNHEARTGFADPKQRLEEMGVVVLDNTHVTIERGRSAIYVAGIRDLGIPSGHRNFYARLSAQLTGALDGLSGRSFTVLLAHRPDPIASYAASGVDLVLAGHTHGGQIRIPLMPPVFAPDQDIWPKYVAGVYRSRATTMVVNRGLGSTLVRQRLFNRPEVVVLVLER